jgi:ATP-binding cassette subfamily B protein
MASFVPRRALSRREIVLDRSVAARAIARVRPYRGRFALLLVCGAVGSVLAVIPAIVLRDFIDSLLRPHPSFEHVLGLSAIGVAVVASAAALSLLQTYLAESVGHNAVADLRADLFEHLLGQSLSYYTRVRAGELLSRVLTDTFGLDSTLGSSLPTLVSNALLTIALVVVMLVFDWRLTLVSLALVPLMALPARRTARRTYRARNRVQEQFATMSAYLQETLGVAGVMLVKSLGRAPQERRRFGEINDELRRREIEADMTGQAYLSMLTVLQLLGPILFLLFGTYLVIHGDTSIGTLLSFAALLVLRLVAAINGGAQALLAILGSLANWGRVFAVLDEPHTVVEQPGARTLERARGELRLEDVTFSYPGQPRPALARVSIDAQPGELVALVGPSGAGKSTLGSLVLRFYDPDRGRVLIDGHDLRELTLASVSALTGVVFQDTFLFNATLRENLLYAREDARENDLRQAIRRAYLERLVGSMPDGLDTIVGERGYRLSGGEKQRVAIARVMLRDPQILLLDEATSHLDTVSERLVQDALSELFRGRTSLVIAHRLSTVVAANKIVVLDGGRVVEQGRHTELLARGGVYVSLYKTQLRDAA